MMIDRDGSQPWQDLAITNLELERCCGLEITQQFMGGLWVGAIRRGCWRSRGSILTLLSTELMVVVLLLMFSLPVGFAIMGRSDATHPSVRRLAGGMVGAASLLYMGRSLWRSRKQRSLHRLEQLLDDVEQFNQLVKSLTLVQHLRGLESQVRSHPEDEASLLSSLQSTRDHLILGLKLDHQLRQHHQQLSNASDVLDRLATQIVSLQVQQKQSGTHEYEQLLSQLIQINRSVEQELQNPYPSESGTSN
jgi:hypothetical protein